MPVQSADPERAGGVADRLTRNIADAIRIDSGVQLRDVGGYRAMQVIARSPGCYWTTADLVDGEGSGHLEISVCDGSAAKPLPATVLRQQPFTEVDETQQIDEGRIVETVTRGPAEFGAVTVHSATLIRPDETYVEVVAKNEDSRTSGRTRVEPPMSALDVLLRLRHLRP